MNIATTPGVESEGLSLRAKASLALEIISLYARARMLLRQRPLNDIVTELRGELPEHARRREQGPSASELHLARIVERTLGVLPADSRCLVRSLVLLALLARRGVVAALVIGVRTDPSFEGHAWVEIGGVSVNPGEETFERLTAL